MVSENWLVGLKEYLKVVKSFAAGNDCYLTGSNGAKINFDTEQKRLDLIGMMMTQTIAEIETEIAAFSLSDHGVIGEDMRVIFQRKYKSEPEHQFDVHRFVDRLRAENPEFEVWVEDPNAPPEVPPR